MARNASATYHTGTVKKTVRINVAKDKLWKKISNIAGLAEWVADVKKTEYISEKKTGIGTVRLITFEDGNRIEEHVVAWKKGESFTYIATEGLPLRAYVATISIKPRTDKQTEITWQSYLNSEKMSEKQFIEFVVFLGSFYEASLENLKMLLEK